MMDPLTALSTASAVVQLVDFGMKVLDETRQIYGEGQVITLEELKGLTHDLVHVNQMLVYQSQPKGLIADPLTDAEKALEKLAVDCSNVATELITCLESLASKPGMGYWESFLQAIRSRWNHDKIKEMRKRIKSFQDQIAVRVLAVINTRTIAQGERQEQRFDRLEQAHGDVVDIVAINRKLLQSTIGNNTAELSHSISQNEQKAKVRHEEIISAILKLRDGSSKVITGNQTNVTPDLHTQETIMTLQRPIFEHVDFHVQNFQVVQSKILDCLHFRQIDHRYDTVNNAHRNTYEWIYHDPDVENKPWSNFSQWLEQGHGCYWVNGKAGSGKSTLMKFIYNHPKTAKSLSGWAGKNELVISSFFLSNLGKSLQKSPAGLIRSLLYDALRRHPHLIPQVVPELCREAAGIQPISKPNEAVFRIHEPPVKLEEPSFSELTKAFQNLIRGCSENLRFCFFIDGVDECEGDYSELLELIAFASHSPHIKILVSSRPITPCVAAFSEFPSLRLQDLTHDDIMVFVQDKVKDQLERRVGDRADALILEIVDRASGVFLWIILVVKSIILGVQSMDRYEDLQRRVDELPEDLMDLYSHMLRNIGPLYAQQASQIFQLILNSVGVVNGEEITTLQLSFADQKPVDAKTTPIREISSSEETRRTEEMDGRIRSRCCGLLEIRDRKYSGGRLMSIRRPTVAFLHRTVFEFLTEQIESKDWLNLATSKSDFDPQLSLASSCLLLAKSLPQQWMVDRDSLPSQCMQNCLYHCSMIDRETGLTTELLDELNRTVSYQFAKVWSPGSDSGEQKFYTAASPFGEALTVCDRPNSFLPLSVTWGLSFYLQDKLDFGDYDEVQLEGLLHLAVTSFILACPGPDTSSSVYAASESLRVMRYAKIISLLLDYGVSPNCRAKGPNENSAWESLLDSLHSQLLYDGEFLETFNDERGYSRTLLNLVVVMIMSAADPNASIIWRSKSYRGVEKPVQFRRSALRIIELLPSGEVADFTHHKTQPAASLHCQQIAQYRTRLISMLQEKHAVSKEWRGSASPDEVNKKPLNSGSPKVTESKAGEEKSRRPWKQISRAFRRTKA
ncbi:uncharacterized protein N7483_009184 [Penicillium malachiteum]|uniref:uncharacterized protein n=1 Tax=Penicillium malachiteum TaxID=1324776 RepID=UPI00254684D3|nr:uncharacterized protein N7483_009184 [Penicillium malachiteum]KAJ5721250.1 hypothetical protein N7483_009184 [Penicillium malachiteum]